jgi:hypothetical protein
VHSSILFRTRQEWKTCARRQAKQVLDRARLGQAEEIASRGYFCNAQPVQNHNAHQLTDRRYKFVLAVLARSSYNTSGNFISLCICVTDCLYGESNTKTIFPLDCSPSHYDSYTLISQFPPSKPPSVRKP